MKLKICACCKKEIKGWIMVVNEYQLCPSCFPEFILGHNPKKLNWPRSLSDPYKNPDYTHPIYQEILALHLEQIDAQELLIKKEMNLCELEKELNKH